VARALKIGMRGERNVHARVTEADVRRIRMSTERGKDLAERYGVTRAAITNIRKRRTWAHVK
jgi:hypothetical protein